MRSFFLDGNPTYKYRRGGGGGGGEGGHQDPGIREGGLRKIFSALRPQFGLNIRGARTPRTFPLDPVDQEPYTLNGERSYSFVFICLLRFLHSNVVDRIHLSNLNG